MKTMYSDSACTTNTISTYYPFPTTLNTATTCAMAGVIPADGYATFTITSKSTQDTPQALVPAPYICT